MNDFTQTDTVPVQLTGPQWDHVLVMLAHHPFNEVAALIGEIQRQCQMHEMRRRTQQPPPRLVPADYGPVEQPG